MTWIGIGNTIGRRRGGATPPDAPTGLAATVVSDSQIDLSWDAVEGATSYKVYYGTDGVTFPYSTTSTTNSKNVTGLNAYTRYYFKISALNGTLEGDASDSVNDWTAWKGVLTSTGDGSGVSAIRLYFQTTNVVATLDGTGKFYSDSGGTTDESSTYTFVAGDLRTRYLKVPSGTSNLLIFAKGNWLKFGDNISSGWESSTNAASLAFTLTGMPVMTHLRITGTSTITDALPTGLTFLHFYGASIAWTYNGALPTGLTYLYFHGASIAWTYNGALPTGLTYLVLAGNSIAWTYNGALPTGLTYLYFNGNSIAWTYNGALPTGLTHLHFYGNSIAWTYNGALPTGLTYLYFNGNSIAWTYNGALPTGLTFLRLEGNSIAWTYNGALPTGLTYLVLAGNSIAWTGLDIGNNGNITSFNLINYRITKMSSADMVTLLTQMKNRTGSLPATVTINDYADYASPPSEVTDAVAALKAAKSITTVNLGA